jgi:hypothetical protein
MMGLFTIVSFQKVQFRLAFSHFSKLVCLEIIINPHLKNVPSAKQATVLGKSNIRSSSLQHLQILIA